MGSQDQAIHTLHVVYYQWQDPPGGALGVEASARCVRLVLCKSSTWIGFCPREAIHDWSSRRPMDRAPVCEFCTSCFSSGERKRKKGR